MRQDSSENMKRRFGDAVRRARGELGISQEELAHRADIHRTYIRDIERGARNPGLVNICRIASALDLTAHELLEMASL